MNQQCWWGALKMAGSYFNQVTDRWYGSVPYLSILKWECLRFIKSTKGVTTVRAVPLAFSPWESLMDSHPICVSVAYFKWSQRGGDKCPVYFWQRTAHCRAKRTYPREVTISWTYITLTGKAFSLTFPKRLLYFKIPNFLLLHIFCSFSVMNHSSFFPYLPCTY